MKTNRDQSIDRLLRRSTQTQGPPSGDCPDAEALAALADAALSGAERQTVEAHVADCHRCQALTAAMLRTIPAGAGDDRGTGEKGVWSLFGGYISRRLPTPFSWSRPTLNWLVPATAAATALALWVAVPGQRSPAPVERQTEVQTPATPPPAPAAAPAPVTGEVDGFRSSLSARDDSQARGNAAGAALGSTASADAQPAAPVENLLKQDESLGRRERVASEEVRAAPEPDQSLLDRTAPLAAARAAAPAFAGFEVVSSDPLIRWRGGRVAGIPGIVVQYSADGGSTWATQETGASTTLTAGSSPSPLVCWLVGRSGTVLRSADGGRQWQRVAFPEAVNLVAVSASNALTATVGLADFRLLSTTDGGQTWAPVQK